MYKTKRHNYSIQRKRDFEIPARSRMINYAYTNDKNIETR
jgi:hypothetical protein